MLTWKTATLSLILGAAMVGCVVEESNPTENGDPHSASISGTIMDENLNALPGAVVMLYSQDDNNYRDCATTNSLNKSLVACLPDAKAIDTTDATGAYSFEKLAAGAYWVSAFKEGYLNQGKSDTLAVGTKSILNLSLSPETTGGIECSQEIAMDCVMGTIDACFLNTGALYHECVIDPNAKRCFTKDACAEGEYCSLFPPEILQKTVATSPSIVVEEKDIAAYGYCLPLGSVDTVPIDTIFGSYCENDKMCGANAHCEWNVRVEKIVPAVESSSAGALIAIPDTVGEPVDLIMPRIGGFCATGAREPIFCEMMYSPVCGYDGITYSNSCVAQGAGTRVSYQGECNPPIDCCASPQ